MDKLELLDIIGELITNNSNIGADADDAVMIDGLEDVMVNTTETDGDVTLTKALEMRDSYMENLAMQTCLVDGAEDICRKLAEKYELYIVTNGACQARDGNGHIRLQQLPDTFCHSKGSGCGYGTMFRQNHFRNTQNSVFYVIGVADHAAHIYGACSGGAGDGCSDAAAGETFGCCQMLPRQGFQNISRKALSHHRSPEPSPHLPAPARSAPDDPASARRSAPDPGWAWSWDAGE